MLLFPKSLLSEFLYACHSHMVPCTLRHSSAPMVHPQRKHPHCSTRGCWYFRLLSASTLEKY